MLKPLAASYAQRPIVCPSTSGGRRFGQYSLAAVLALALAAAPATHAAPSVSDVPDVLRRTAQRAFAGAQPA